MNSVTVAPVLTLAFRMHSHMCGLSLNTKTMTTGPAVVTIYLIY